MLISLSTLVILLLVDGSLQLQCWKCLQHDCDTNPENNFKASTMTCNVGEACMKVNYRMFDNVTSYMYDATTRTCSYGTCKSTSEADFHSCLKNHRKYMVEGCALRKCCTDKDLCNHGDVIAPSKCWIVYFWNILILTLFYNEFL